MSPFKMKRLSTGLKEDSGTAGREKFIKEKQDEGVTGRRLSVALAESPYASEQDSLSASGLVGGGGDILERFVPARDINVLEKKKDSKRKQEADAKRKFRLSILEKRRSVLSGQLKATDDDDEIARINRELNDVEQKILNETSGIERKLESEISPPSGTMGVELGEIKRVSSVITDLDGVQDTPDNRLLVRQRLADNNFTEAEISQIFEAKGWR